MPAATKSNSKMFDEWNSVRNNLKIVSFSINLCPEIKCEPGCDYQIKMAAQPISH